MCVVGPRDSTNGTRMTPQRHDAAENKHADGPPQDHPPTMSTKHVPSRRRRRTPEYRGRAQRHEKRAAEFQSLLKQQTQEFGLSHTYQEDRSCDLDHQNENPRCQPQDDQEPSRALSQP